MYFSSQESSPAYTFTPQGVIPAGVVAMQPRHAVVDPLLRVVPALRWGVRNVGAFSDRDIGVRFIPILGGRHGDDAILLDRVLAAVFDEPALTATLEPERVAVLIERLVEAGGHAVSSGKCEEQKLESFLPGLLGFPYIMDIDVVGIQRDSELFHQGIVIRFHVGRIPYQKG